MKTGSHRQHGRHTQSDDIVVIDQGNSADSWHLAGGCLLGDGNGMMRGDSGNRAATVDRWLCHLCVLTNRRGKERGSGGVDASNLVARITIDDYQS